jgi:hypothetical protein
LKQNKMEKEQNQNKKRKKGKGSREWAERDREPREDYIEALGFSGRGGKPIKCIFFFCVCKTYNKKQRGKGLIMLLDTICKKGIETLKFSARLACQTRRTFVRKKVPRLPWSDDKFHTPFICAWVEYLFICFQSIFYIKKLVHLVILIVKS